jgi:hypothetical protein
MAKITGSFRVFRSLKMKSLFRIPSAITNLTIAALSGTSMQIGFTAAANSIASQYSLDGGTWLPITPGQVITGIAAGSHTVQVRGVNAGGVAGPATATPVVLTVVYNYASTAAKTLSASPNTSQGALFGYSLDISNDGKTMVVGAPYESSSLGAVYVFSLVGGTWTRTARIQNPYGSGFINFGYKVAISGDGLRFAVATNSTVTVFKYTTSWVSESGQLEIDTNAQVISFSDNGDFLIASGGGNQSRGYVRTGSTWASGYGINITNIGNYANSFELSGDGLSLVAATNSTTVFVFDRSSGNPWSGTAITMGSTMVAASMSGDGLVLAATSFGSSITEIYTRPRRSSFTWTRLTTLSRGNPANSASGQGLALSENGSLLITCSDFLYNGVPEVRFYKRNGTALPQVNVISGSASARFGYHCALARNESVVLVGIDTASTEGLTNSGGVVVVTPSS